LGAAGFLAAASAGAVAGVGRGDGNGALASGGVEDGGDDNPDAGGRGAEGVVVCPGSGAMMLMGGVEAALGNSVEVDVVIHCRQEVICDAQALFARSA
jgi:hypothetical protein